MANSEIGITITAQNLASGELAKLQKDVDAVTKVILESAKTLSGTATPHMHGFGAATKNTGRELRDVLIPVRLLAGGLASELNPALGQIVFAASAASRGLQRLPLALAAVG